MKLKIAIGSEISGISKNHSIYLQKHVFMSNSVYFLNLIYMTSYALQLLSIKMCEIKTCIALEKSREKWYQ